MPVVAAQARHIKTPDAWLSGSFVRAREMGSDEATKYVKKRVVTDGHNRHIVRVPDGDVDAYWPL